MDLGPPTCPLTYTWSIINVTGRQIVHVNTEVTGQTPQPGLPDPYPGELHSVFGDVSFS